MTISVGPFGLLPSELAIIEFATIEEWERHAQTVFGMQRWSPWWVGDMVKFGEARFGEEFSQVVPLDYSVASLERFANVARKIPPEDRSKSLSFQHHIISLQVKEPAVRRALLRRAETEMLNTEEFGRLVRGTLC